MKLAALYDFTRQPVATVEIGDDFYGYPPVVEYEGRFFEFAHVGGFQIDAVNSANMERYREISAPYQATAPAFADA